MTTRKWLLAFASFSTLAAVQPAFAQDTAPVAEDAAADGEIIVTARRRDERLQDVPISVTALSGEALESKQITDAVSLGQNVPSLSITNAGALKSTVAFSIRGQRTQETQILTDPPVGLYFAEVNQPRTLGLAASFYDLQSIQVLKGVQGTLFGRNMTGGAVLVEPAHPTDRFEGRFKAGIGNYDMRELEGMVNVPLGDFAAIRVAGRLNRRDGYVIDQSNGRDYMDDHSDALRVSLKLTPGSGFENLTILDYIKTDEHGVGIVGDFYKVGGATGAFGLINAAWAGAFGGTPNTPGNQIPNSPAFGSFAGLRVYRPVTDMAALLATQAAIRNSSNPYRIVGSGIGQGGPFDLNPVGGGVLPFERVENYGVTNKTTLALGENLSLKNVFGYRKIKFDTTNDLDGTAAPLIHSAQSKDIEVFSEELQLSGKAMDGRLDFVTGLYYFVEKGDDTSVSMQFPELRIAFDPRPAAFTSNNLLSGNQGGGKATSYAAYGGITAALTDSLKLSLGARYTHDKREIVARGLRGDGLPSATNPTATNGYLNACQFNATPVPGIPNPPVAPAPDCGVRTQKNWSAVTYDATLAYQPDGNTNIYGSFRKGFRAGAYSLRAVSYQELVPADPETVYEYELGFKNTSNVGGGRFTTAAALFYQDYSNVQRQVPVATPAGVGTQILNIAKEHIYGGEIEANLEVGRIDVGLGYSFTKIVVDEIAANIANQYADSGIPRHQFNGNLTWHLPIDESLGDLQLGANLSFKSRIRLGANTASGTGGNQPAYELVDLRLQWNDIAGSNFSAGAFVKNVFDQFYRLGTIDIVSSTGIGGSIYGAPRTYGMSASYKF
ncbi:MAG: TonB-dependent receptor [Sphingorhabdus sp.]